MLELHQEKKHPSRFWLSSQPLLEPLLCDNCHRLAKICVAACESDRWHLFQEELDFALDDWERKFLRFSVRGIRNYRELAESLNDQSRLVSQYLLQLFSAQTRDLLAKFEKRKPDPPGLQKELAIQLILIIHGPSIYEAKRFKDVTLSPKTQRALKLGGQRDRFVPLNQLLLADAYGGVISTTEARRVEEAGPSTLVKLGPVDKGPDGEQIIRPDFATIEGTFPRALKQLATTKAGETPKPRPL